MSKKYTEADKLTEARKLEKSSSSFIDEEIKRAENDNLDRDMLVAGMNSWIISKREVIRIETEEKWRVYKKECEQLEREAFNKKILEEMDGKSD